MMACCSFFFQAEDGIRDGRVTGVQTCALPIFEEGPELGGEETVLGEAPPLPGEEVEEEVVVVPVEPEAPEAAPPAPTPVEEPQPEVAGTPEAAPPPTPAPAYEAEAPPAYEPEATTPAVVHGEA